MAARSRSSPRGYGRSTGSTPTSSWSCSPALVTATACPTASVSGSSDRIDRPRHHVRGRADLRPFGCGSHRWSRLACSLDLPGTCCRSTSRPRRKIPRSGCCGAPQGMSRAGRPGWTSSTPWLAAGVLLGPREKPLLVLDQFEQWLFARRSDPDPALVPALRHCDGEHVQSVLMVRDDFWMAVTRFMRDLEVPSLKARTPLPSISSICPMRAVSSRRSAGPTVLPENASDLTADQLAFLEQSVAGLAHDGKVIPVRLALSLRWSRGSRGPPATLRDVGGIQGIGVTFLDETFSASDRAARAPTAPAGGPGRPEGPPAR